MGHCSPATCGAPWWSRLPRGLIYKTGQTSGLLSAGQSPSRVGTEPLVGAQLCVPSPNLAGPLCLRGHRGDTEAPPGLCVGTFLSVCERRPKLPINAQTASFNSYVLLHDGRTICSVGSPAGLLLTTGWPRTWVPGVRTNTSLGAVTGSNCSSRFRLLGAEGSKHPTRKYRWPKRWPVITSCVFALRKVEMAVSVLLTTLALVRACVWGGGGRHIIEEGLQGSAGCLS